MSAQASTTPLQAARAAARARRFREPALWLPLLCLLALLVTPALAPSFRVLDLVVKMAIFAALAASYDVLLGYTGIVSFGHAMFFGVGAYGVALALTRFGAPTWGHLATGLAVAIVCAALAASVIGAFSLRVKAIFFAMITLAFAEFALILAVQLTAFTGGEDGLSPTLPGALAVAGPGAALLGVTLPPRLVAYYLVALVCAGLFVVMARFVDSPLGRTLQAIRDNALRAEALGLPTFRFQLVATAFASAVAALLGGCYALWVRYVNPESVLGIHVMLDVLLMVIIGGIGSLWGGIIGAAVLLTAQTLLPDLRLLGTSVFASAPLLARLTERWQLWVGVLFILAVFFFPRGVIGTLRGATSKDSRR